MPVEIAGHRLSIHAEAMLKERELKTEWITDALTHPERRELADDRLMHYIRTIPEFGGRRLRVVVNESVDPPKISPFSSIAA